jgi:hypothetical protein
MDGEAKRNPSQLVRQAMSQGIEWTSLSQGAWLTLQRYAAPASFFNFSLRHLAERDLGLVRQQQLSEAEEVEIKKRENWIAKQLAGLQEELAGLVEREQLPAPTATVCFICSRQTALQPAHKICPDCHAQESCGTCQRMRARRSRCHLPWRDELLGQERTLVQLLAASTLMRWLRTI